MAVHNPFSPPLYIDIKLKQKQKSISSINILKF
uniref:Uncharacterized protein n=1 Tax=virus sp. ctML55 TaxID=2827627 RepID=A0A8S5RIR8_9VIRU|nr:MAG TPA: hypothetical protein [virus sp. ctML55]